MSTPTSKEEAAQAYWKDNLRLMLVLLVVWFSVSFGAGILFVEQLNNIWLFGFPLGFWFAQQGSIYIFVLMIFFYIWKMNQYDRKHNVHEE
jgi:putative solute:sodium symporter small subunit